MSLIDSVGLKTKWLLMKVIRRHFRSILNLSKNSLIIKKYSYRFHKMGGTIFKSTKIRKISIIIETL